MSLYSGIRKYINRFKTAYRIKKNNVKIEKNVVIKGVPSFYGKGQVTIAEDVKINSALRYNPIGGQDGCIFDTRKNGEITIGKNSRISNSVFVADTSIAIGDNVFIGGSCKFYDTDFHSIHLEERLLKDDPNIRSKPIVIKNGAFIGAHSIILKGVQVGENAVVGAGSVVTHNIPDGEIWAGNPARFVKRID